MTADQFKLLLTELAQVAGLAETSGLLEHGQLKIGEVEAVLEHSPAFDPDLLQLRMQLGDFRQEQRESITMPGPPQVTCRCRPGAGRWRAVPPTPKTRRSHGPRQPHRH